MTRNILSLLPDLEGFRRRTQSLAALDAILSPEWEYRYFSFDSEWGEEQMASMRNGQGDHWFAILASAGCALVGLDHESESFEAGNPKPWVFDGLPEDFDACLKQEPAFGTDNSTYCLWRLAGDHAWRRGAVPERVDDGHEAQLDLLAHGAERYLEWAASYHEVELLLEDVESVFLHEPITRERVARMNPEADFDALADDLRAIGFPSTKRGELGA